MLQQLGRYLINCPYLGVYRCEAPKHWDDDKPLNLDWEPEDCGVCIQCISFVERKEAS